MISSLSQLDTCGWSYNMILRLMPSVFIIERLGCSRNFGQWQLMMQEMYNKWLMRMCISTSGVHMDFRDPLFMQ